MELIIQLQNMIDGLKRTWEELMRSEPGLRFQDRNDRHRMHGLRDWNRARILKPLLGVAIIVPGIIMIPAPGPGAVIVVLGLALVADEYRPVAIFLDRSELGLRSAYAKVWGRASTTQRVIVTLLGTVVCAVACYWAYLYFFAKTAQAV